LRNFRKSAIAISSNESAGDYDNQEQWSFSEALILLNTAAIAFQDWESIRTHPMAGDYLLTMLLQKQR
jgi:hypothetical protein